jgi:hypothetical protein
MVRDHKQNLAMPIVPKRKKHARCSRMRAARTCQESCVRDRFHLIGLFDAKPVAEHDGELGHGSGPLALSILPLSADTAQGKVQ